MTDGGQGEESQTHNTGIVKLFHNLSVTTQCMTQEATEAEDTCRNMLGRNNEEMSC